MKEDLNAYGNELNYYLVACTPALILASWDYRLANIA